MGKNKVAYVEGRCVGAAAKSTAAFIIARRWNMYSKPGAKEFRV